MEYLKRRRATQSHQEPLVSEYRKMPALMMTGKSSLWGPGAKGREQMGTYAKAQDGIDQGSRACKLLHMQSLVSQVIT